jgi:hypothetical protein
VRRTLTPGPALVNLIMMIERKSGEIALELTDEQYRKLCNR